MTADNAPQQADKPESGRKPLSQFLFAPNSEIPRPKRATSNAPEPIFVVETDAQRLHAEENRSNQTTYPTEFYKNPVQRIDYPLYDTGPEAEPDSVPVLPKQPVLPVFVAQRPFAPAETAQADEIAPGAPFPLDDFSKFQPTLFRRYLSILHEKQARERLTRQRIPALSVAPSQNGSSQSGAPCQNEQHIETGQDVCDDALFSSLSPEARACFRQFLRSLG